MATPRLGLKASGGSALTTAARLITFTLVCGILYWGRAIFVPVALAILLSFVLSPLVRRLERWRFPRVSAVVSVAVIASTAIGSLLWLVTAQMSELAEDIPAKREIIKEKLAYIQGMGRGGSIEVIQDTFESVKEEIDHEEAQEMAASKGDSKPSVQIFDPVNDPKPMAPEEKEEGPIPVTVVPKSEVLDWSSVKALTPVFASAGQIGLVFILVILLLISEEDLRGRLVNVAGEARLAVTTNALHNAGKRISSYLGIQLILNASYGVVIGVGLYFFGVPYAYLWGVCAAVFRYIPYVGPWIAALLPISTTLVSSPGWTTVGGVIGLFILLELVSNNIVEPWLYGKSVGIPAFILLISAIFWTWLWGPVGLILSTPLTVCLVALGEHVESLNFLARMLGSEQQQPPHLLLYQRLLARDDDGATNLIEKHVTEVESGDLYTATDALSRDVIAPVLSLIKRDATLEALHEDEKERILLLLNERIASLTELHSHADFETDAPRMILCPASDAIDETAANLLALVLKAGGASCEVISHALLASEVNQIASAERTRLITIVSVSPGGISSALRLCKRLEALENNIDISVSYWGDLSETSKSTLTKAGARNVSQSLWGAHDLLAPMDQFFKSQEAALPVGA